MRDTLALAFCVASIMATALAYASHLDASIDHAFAERALAAHRGTDDHSQR